MQGAPGRQHCVCRNSLAVSALCGFHFPNFLAAADVEFVEKCRGGLLNKADFEFKEVLGAPHRSARVQVVIARADPERNLVMKQKQLLRDDAEKIDGLLDAPHRLPVGCGRAPKRSFSSWRKSASRSASAPSSRLSARFSLSTCWTS